MSRAHGRFILTMPLIFICSFTFGGPPALLDVTGDPLPPAACARLGSLRLWHGPAVTDLIYCSDGKAVISAGDDPEIRLWDTATGKELRAFRGHEGNVYSVALRPDGQVLASAGEDKTIRLWDVNTGREIRRWEQEEPCLCLRFSPNGKILVMALQTDKLTALLWDLETHKELRRLTYPVDDDRQGMIMLGGFRGLPGEMQVQRRDTSVAFAADGRHFIYSKANRIYWCDSTTGKKVRRYDVAEPTFGQPRLSPDGRSLAVGTNAGNIFRWETDSVEDLPPFKDLNTPIFLVAFAPDGKWLAGAGQDGSVRFFYLAGDKPAALLKVDGGQIRSMAFSPDGNTLAIGDMAGSIHFIDVTNGKERVLPGGRPTFESVAFDETSSTIASAEHGSVRRWDACTGKAIRQVPVAKSNAMYTALSPSGDVLAIAENGVGLHLLNTSTGKEISKLPGIGQYIIPIFAPDGKAVALPTADERGAIAMVHVSSGKEIRRFKTAEGIGSLPASSPEGQPPVNLPLTFTPDGALMISTSPGKRLLVWETASGKLRRKFRVAMGEPTGNLADRGVAVTPDSRLLAMAQNENVALLELATGKIVRRLDGHEENVTTLAVSPDGKLLATGSMDRTVRLWDIATGMEKARLTGHRGAVRQVAFSPDGRSLLSSSEDRTALVWTVAEALRQGILDKSAVRRDANGDELWHRLADEDATRADKAVQELIDQPGVAVPMLVKRLQPVPPPPGKLVASLLAALDGQQFAERERAARRLAALRDQAVPPLRRILDNLDSSAEARRRSAALLEEVEDAPLPREWMRVARAVEVLERIGTPTACSVLETMSKGDPDSRLTQRAKESLTRLTKQQRARPQEGGSETTAGASRARP